MFEKKTILVTGCSDHGLGAALALALQERGWRVFASARTISKMSAVETAGIKLIQLDVTSEQSIAEAVISIQQLTGGSLDAILSNAGAGYSIPLIHTDIDKAHEIFDLNAFSIIRLTRAFLPLLQKSQSGGLIVNNTSAMGLLGCGIPMQGPYNASKAAAASITEGLRIELAPLGIRVVNLVTGMIRSTFADNASKGELPPDSPYSPAKARIEEVMSGPPPDFVPTDAAKWARQVAGDISKERPSYMLFRGSNAFLARLCALLPLGLIDHVLNQAGGLDVLAQSIKSQGHKGTKAL